MESLLGITGKDFVMLASDTLSARSIVIMKDTEDKSCALNPHTVLLYSGEPGDTVNFAEYIQRNVQLYGIKNGTELSPKAAANFTRRELASSLRTRQSYAVNLIIGGFDVTTGEPNLYWLDYMAAMTPLKFASQGHGSYFCLSLMDRYYKPNMNLEEVKGLMRMCLQELKTRFVINLPAFKVKVVDKDGIREEDL